MEPDRTTDKSAPGQAPSSPNGWRPASETETAGGSSSAALTCTYCGLLDWTVRKYGRVTHKQACPHRTDPWHQGDPKASAACPNCGAPVVTGRCSSVTCQNHNGPSAAKVALLFPASRTIANVTTWAVRRGK